MTDECEQEPHTQPTQPKGIDPKTGKPYEPVEIPVPERSDWERVLARAAKTEDHRADQQQDAEDD